MSREPILQRPADSPDEDRDLRPQRMREMVGLDSEQRRTRFDSIRLDKGLRREFARFGVARNGLDADTVGQLQALDFDVY